MASPEKSWLTYQLSKHEALRELLVLIWVVGTNPWLTADVVFLIVSIASPIIVSYVFRDLWSQLRSQNEFSSSASPICFNEVFSLSLLVGVQPCSARSTWRIFGVPGMSSFKRSLQIISTCCFNCEFFTCVFHQGCLSRRLSFAIRESTAHWNAYRNSVEYPGSPVSYLLHETFWLVIWILTFYVPLFPKLFLSETTGWTVPTYFWTWLLTFGNFMNSSFFFRGNFLCLVLMELHHYLKLLTSSWDGLQLSSFFFRPYF